MKTRNGFVSNSSSSSFVIVVPTTVVDEVIKDYTPYEKKFINFVRKNKEFMGVNISLFSGCTGNEDSWEYNFDFTKKRDDMDEDIVDEEDIIQNNRDYFYEVWNEFIKKLKKAAGKNIISDDMEF